MSDPWEDDLLYDLRNPPVMSMVVSRDDLYTIMVIRMGKAADEINRLRAELAIAQAQSGDGAIGKFFDWISDHRTPAYVALFWFVFLIGTIAAVSSAVVSPSVFPTIAIVAIGAGGALAFAYRRHLKATEGDE